MKHTLVIIGSLDENIILAKTARQRGYRVVICDGYADGPARQYADASYTVPVRDTDRIAQICKDEGADGIIGCFSDLVMEMVTEIAAKAGLKWYITPEMLPFYRDKFEAHKLMHSVGIRVPAYCLVPADDILEALRTLRLPIVIKPLSGWGSKGIYIIHNEEEFHKLAPQVREAFGTSEILAEEYIPAHEHNAICYVTEGKVNSICIGDRARNPAVGNGIPMLNRIMYPSTHMEELYPKVLKVMQTFIEATGQTSGPLAMQFFYYQNEVVVCEIAGRFLAHELEMINRYSGLKLEELLLDYVYDEEHNTEVFRKYRPSPERPCAGLYMLCRHGEQIADMEAAYTLQQDPHAFVTTQFYKTGETVDNHSSKCYFTRYYLYADTFEEMDEVTERFFREFRIYNEKGENIAYEFILEKMWQ
ncbi:MAG: ATP-grasp domain-containing protein [Oscillospiraceae bacterium]|nr:ATP-grasp domain-containing protein [Oscillospiraceae bacterium]